MIGLYGFQSRAYIIIVVRKKSIDAGWIKLKTQHDVVVCRSFPTDEEEVLEARTCQKLADKIERNASTNDPLGSHL